MTLARERFPSDAAAVASERLYRGAFAVLLCASAGLTLLHRYLPLVDWPEHLAQDAIVAHLHDPAYGFDRYYRVTGWFIPYEGFRWLHIALAQLLGDLLGGRVALLSYVVGMPLAAAALVRRLGRDPWVSLGAFCVLVDANLLWGFAPHVLGTTLLLLGLVLIIDYAKQGQRWRLVALGTLGLALFLTHAQQTALWIGSTGLVLIVGYSRGAMSARRALAASAAVVPAAVLLAWYLVGGGWVDGRAVHGSFAIEGGTNWSTLSERFWALPLSTGLGYTGNTPIMLFGVALTAIAFGSWAARSPTPAEEAPGFGFVGPLLAAVWSALVFVLPAEFRGQTIAARVASLAALALLWTPPMNASKSAVAGWRLRVAHAALFIVACASIGWAHVCFARFATTMQAMDRIAAIVPRGSRVASMVYGPRPPGFRLPSYLHVGGYLVAERGGMSSVGFTRTGVTYRDELPRNALMVNELWKPSVHGWQLDLRQFGPYYDYVLVHAGPLYHGSPFLDATGSLWTGERIVKDGAFELWRVVRRPDTSRAWEDRKTGRL